MKPKKETKKRRAFTLIEVLVVVACVGILALVLLPRYLASRPRALPTWPVCLNNLQQVGVAFRIWEGDHGKGYPMGVSTNKGGTLEWGAGANMFRHFQALSNDLGDPKFLTCVADTRKPAGDFSDLMNSNVSYFVGLDADEAYPTMPLAGDRNLVINGVAARPGLAVIKTNDLLAWSTGGHKSEGILLLADGSAQRTTNAWLQVFFRRSGSPTDINRLAIP